MRLRERTIALLKLQPGDVVMDVGAGTGLSYSLLSQQVGPSGRVLAFEQSADMFHQACARVEREGLSNVWHCHASAELVELPAQVDAVLFNYVHDISRTPAAVENVMRFVKPGARVAMAGMKFFPWWTGPLNLLAWAKNRPYNARASELWSPWDRVAACCERFSVTATQCGMGFMAHGIKRR